MATETSSDGSSTTTYSDQTTISVSRAPDPRFGPSAPVGSTTITLPSSQQLTVERSRSVTPAAPYDLLDLDTLTETATLKGTTDLTYTQELDFTASPNTLISTTPQGRVTTATLDSLRRIHTLDNDVVAALNVSYDVYGRVNQLDQGSRRIKINWDSSTGFVDSLWAGTTQNEEKYFVDLSIDARGQLGGMTRNDGKQVLFGYDDSSNMTLLQRPNGSGFVDHDFTSNDLDLVTMYDAPDVTGSTGQTQYEWDLDRRLDTITWPDNTGVRVTYHPAGSANAGKPNQLETLGGQALTTYGYGTGTGNDGRLTTITTADSVITTMGWNGPALTSVATTWPDTMSKSVTWGIGEYLRVASEQVTGGNLVTYGYDNDGLVSSVTVGSTTLVVDLNQHMPRVDGVHITGYWNEVWTHDSVYGELTDITAGGSLYHLGLDRDDLGRDHEQDGDDLRLVDVANLQLPQRQRGHRTHHRQWDLDLEVRQRRQRSTDLRRFHLVRL